MAWENRGNQRYYYRRRKVAGKIVTEYIGAGLLAVMTAEHDLLDRICAENDREALRRVMAKDAAVDRQLSDFRSQAKQAVAAALAEHGYHLHKRSEWRKSRSMSEQTQLVKAQPVQAIGILASVVAQQIIRCAGAKDKKVEAALLDEVADLRSRLGWADAPAHERLLIEAVAVAWLRLQFVEQNLAHNSTSDNYKNAAIEHIERRLTMCHRRYMESVTALARVRKLAINVQINVGQNQVITGG